MLAGVEVLEFLRGQERGAEHPSAHAVPGQADVRPASQPGHHVSLRDPPRRIEQQLAGARRPAAGQASAAS